MMAHIMSKYSLQTEYNASATKIKNRGRPNKDNYYIEHHH